MLMQQQSAEQVKAQGGDDADVHSGGGGGGSLQLEEGQVIVDVARLEAEADAIRTLQAQVEALQQELDDERQDSQRKDGEIRDLTKMLREKERLLQDAGAALADVQRNNDSLKERSDQLLREKIEAVGELESLRSSLDEDTSRVRYQMQELEVTLSTLTQENNALKQEIAELGGDSDGHGRKGKKNLISTDTSHENDDDLVSKKTPVIGRRSEVNNGSADDKEARALTAAERKLLLEEMSEQFQSVCLKYKIEDNASAELFAVVDRYALEAERTATAIEEKFTTSEKTQTKRIKDLEEQRIRMEKDLQARIENVRII